MRERPVRDAVLEIRALRSFIAVAEELSFTRAAARLFVAQQAMSRDIQLLERRLGVPLFVRTTRHVTLTPEGHRLLARAKELVVLHDRVLDDMLPIGRPIIVDLLSDGRLTGPRVLDALRKAAPTIEFRSRYGGAAGMALRQVAAAEIDIALGRADWVGRARAPGLQHRLLRLEPIAVMLPDTHPLAPLPEVPVGALAGLEIDANPAHPEAHEWSDLVQQLLPLAGARSTPPHDPATSLHDQADHLVRQGLPILTGIDHVAVPGGVVRQLRDPIPLYPWSIVWRRGIHPELLAAIEAAHAALTTGSDWLAKPDGHWLPEPEAASHASLRRRATDGP
jgi:DNA-binding transcriptional LysR family regulator